MHCYRRGLDVTDHLQAQAVGRLETQWKYCVRWASSPGIGVPVCFPRTQAHCAVMSAIVGAVRQKARSVSSW